MRNKGQDYSIKQIDLSKKTGNTDKSLDYLFEYSIVDEGNGYLGHPDSILLKNGDILTFFPEGHGRGKVLSKRSIDGGKTYLDGDGVKNPPENWALSKETPTVYRLTFSERNWDDKLILICGNPKWWDEKSSVGGFNCSVSDDEGESFS